MHGPAQATGLGQGLPGGLARWQAPRPVHDPGGSGLPGSA